MRADGNRELRCIQQQARAEIRRYRQKLPYNGRIVAKRPQYQRTLKEGPRRHPDGDTRSSGWVSLDIQSQLGIRTSSINLIGA